MTGLRVLKVAMVAAILSLGSASAAPVPTTEIEVEPLEEGETAPALDDPLPLIEPDLDLEPEFGLESDASTPEPLFDAGLLPRAVGTTRDLLISAASSGDVNQLAEIWQRQDAVPLLSFGEPAGDGDPVEQFRMLSGDAAGLEAMAILIDVLNAGYVHVEEGTENEMYIWPWFYRATLDGLTPPEKVQLFQIVTAADFEAMQEFGAYNFFRVGITPDGEWAFFVAGD